MEKIDTIWLIVRHIVVKLLNFEELEYALFRHKVQKSKSPGEERKSDYQIISKNKQKNKKQSQ